MYTCAQGCTYPGHRHIRKVSLYSDAHDRAVVGRRAAPKKPVARPAATTKTVKNAKGRSLRIDIHCHYLNVEVAARVAPLKPMECEPLHIYANPLTRDVNARQMKERGAMLTSIETRLRDMDKMGIDIQAVAPAPFQYYYWTEPGYGAELACSIPLPDWLCPRCMLMILSV